MGIVRKNLGLKMVLQGMIKKNMMVINDEPFVFPANYSYTKKSSYSSHILTNIGSSHMDAQNLFSLSSCMRSFLTACGVKVASILKTSYIVGSHAAFFSASSIAMPLMGAWSSIPAIMMTFAFGFAVRMALGASLLPMFAFWVPGLCAALYWQLPSRFYRFGLPLLCMILFLVHPTGLAAAPYALYWFIPMVIAFRTSNSIWHDALASTFIAHAVGSVIWIYTVPMSAAVWLALIPVVACERTLYTAGIVMGHTMISYCVEAKKNFVFGLPLMSRDTLRY
jgi:hypothetical protein